MQGLEIDVVYEHGSLKLPRHLPFVEGATLRITIHPPGRTGVIKHVEIGWTGSHEELERWLNDPDEGIHGNHDVCWEVGMSFRGTARSLIRLLDDWHVP
jgi:hypothetical protein